MTFLMSCMRGESPHCHCHSQASSREGARRTARLLGATVQAACLPLERPVDKSSSEQPWLSFYTVCGLEMNVKTYCGHLPFCASWA